MPDHGHPTYGPEVSIDPTAYIHPSAAIYGKVSVAEGASLWANVVIRSEAFEVRVGRFTNIQDFTMMHVGWETPAVVGDYCSVTHHCTIHGCTIGDHCLIGINATIMDGAVIGDNCIVGQHAFVKDGTVVPDNSIVVGSPAKVIRTQNSYVANKLNALLYHRNAQAYMTGDHRAWQGPGFEDFLKRARDRLEREFEERFI
jgi:carbonic anhydrase/acetyltransferase-like protein (isoleucine patch superfamily)